MDDEFSLVDIIHPEHERNATEFVSFFKAELVYGQPIEEYLSGNQLGFHIGPPPQIISIKYSGSGIAKEMALSLQATLDEKDRQSANGTEIVLRVSLGNLYTDHKKLDSHFKSIAAIADMARKNLDGKVSPEKLSQLKTGEETYREAWENHNRRCELLTADRLNEIRNKVLELLNSAELQNELQSLNGKIIKVDMGDSSNTTLIQVHFMFS